MALYQITKRRVGDEKIKRNKMCHLKVTNKTNEFKKITPNLYDMGCIFMEGLIYDF